MPGLRRTIDISAVTPRRPIIQAAHEPLAKLIDDAGLFDTCKPFYFSTPRSEHFEASFELSCFEVIVTLDVLPDQRWCISATSEHKHTLEREPWAAATALVAAVVAENAGGGVVDDYFDELGLGVSVAVADAKARALLTLANGRERRWFSRRVVVNEA